MTSESNASFVGAKIVNISSSNASLKPAKPANSHRVLNSGTEQIVFPMELHREEETLLAPVIDALGADVLGYGVGSTCIGVFIFDSILGLSVGSDVISIGFALGLLVGSAILSTP